MEKMILADNAEHYVYMKEDLRRFYDEKMPAEVLSVLDGHLADLLAVEAITLLKDLQLLNRKLYSGGV